MHMTGLHMKLGTNDLRNDMKKIDGLVAKGKKLIILYT